MTTNPETLNELALFAGAGGGILGGILCGFRTVCAVEIDGYARRSLMARQDDGCTHPYPIWDDVTTFDGKPWRGLVDVVSGGFPCTDIAACKRDAEGIDGSKSGLWREMARIIGEVRPRFVLVENSPMLVGRGLAVVLGDLAEMGYDARWGCMGGDIAGLPHHRTRLWLVAYPNDKQREKPLERLQEIRLPLCVVPLEMGSWLPEPALLGINHGVADVVDRCRAIGNGQVPAVVRIAWNLLQPQDSLSKSNR
jgi:DNA (cytosine-5)-methyltransferase 1